MNKINCEKLVNEISTFIKSVYRNAGRQIAIIGISGGVDSSVVNALCQKTGLGVQRIFMPYEELSLRSSVKENFSDVIEIDITESVNCLIDSIEKNSFRKLNKIQKGNIMARVRMLILYDFAKRENGLVLGTENKSEYYLGYFTLYGDQACDLNPIGGLWKTQVIELAEYLGLKIEIPSAGLYEGQTDETQLGFTYEEADPILDLYCRDKLEPQQIINCGYDTDLVNRVIKQVMSTQFKREKIPQYILK